MFCYVTLCYIMLCYVMLCFVLLCYAMSCYVMLCSVKSYRAEQGSHDMIQLNIRLLQVTSQYITAY